MSDQQEPVVDGDLHGDIATTRDPRNCIALKPNGEQCRHPKSSATKKYVANSSDAPILGQLCAKHRQMYQDDASRVRWVTDQSEITIGDDGNLTALDDDVDYLMIDQQADAKASSTKSDQIPPALPTSSLTRKDRSQSAGHMEARMNDRELLKLGKDHGKLLGQLYWETKKQLEDIEESQQAYHKRAWEEMRTMINTVKAVNQRISEEAQVATLAAEDVKNKLRTVFTNVTADIQSLKIEVQKLREGGVPSNDSAGSIVADQVKKLERAVRELCIQKVDVSDNRAEKREQLLEEINAQTHLLNIDTTKFANTYGESLRLEA